MNLSKTTYYILLCCAFILGVGVYVVRFTAFAGNEYKVLQEILSIIGNILIVGVVVGFFTTVIQNFGFFKEELGKVIFDKKFLANRKDIREIWLNASKVVFEGKFPQIHEDFFARMFEYLQCKDVAYYNNYEMHISLEWLSQDKHLVKVKKHIIFELVAHSEKHQVYTYKSWLRLSSDNEYSSKIDILVNGVPPKQKHVTRKTEEKNDFKTEIISVGLKGSMQYDIHISEEKVYDLDSDFIIGFRAKHITNNFRVQLVHPENVRAMFVPCGTQMDFQEVNNTKTINENRYNHVLLPKQGFIIALNPIKND